MIYSAAMKSRTWMALALVTNVAYGQPAVAAPSCADQLTTYDKWLAPIQSDLEKGAVSSDHVDQLFAIPLRVGSPPQQSAMTLVVDKAGLHDGGGDARSASEAGSLISANRNLVFAKSNKNAISHGILVFASVEAPATSVRAAVVAALASHEKVWLVFRPSDGQAAPPATSAVTAELDKLDAKDVSGLVKIVKREFGKCDGLITMLQTLSNDTESSRLELLVDAPHPALAKCSCKTQPNVVASVLWKLTFSNLAVVVPVPTKGADALPWGDAKSTWQDVAPAVIKVLAK